MERNPYQEHKLNVHTCEGEFCPGCKRDAWRDGYQDGSNEAAPILHAAIQTWQIIEQLPGTGIVIEGLDATGKLGLKAALRWMKQHIV